MKGEVNFNMKKIAWGLLTIWLIAFGALFIKFLSGGPCGFDAPCKDSPAEFINYAIFGFVSLIIIIFFIIYAYSKKPGELKK